MTSFPLLPWMVALRGTLSAIVIWSFPAAASIVRLFDVTNARAKEVFWPFAVMTMSAPIICTWTLSAFFVPTILSSPPTIATAGAIGAADKTVRGSSDSRASLR